MKKLKMRTWTTLNQYGFEGNIEARRNGEQI